MFSIYIYKDTISIQNPMSNYRWIILHIMHSNVFIIELSNESILSGYSIYILC